MTNFSSLKFTAADVVKFIGGTAAAITLYAKIIAAQQGIEAKLDRFIAQQNGKDNVQDVRIGGLEMDVEDLLAWRAAFVSQPARKPDPISIEVE